MKKSAILNWIFSIAFVIQLLFSRDWMYQGEVTLWFALQPLIGSVLVIFRPTVFNIVSGKFMISLLIASGCQATLTSVHAVESGTLSWGIWLYVITLVGLLWQLMGFWSNVDTRLNKKLGIAINLLVPFLFGVMLLYLWEMFTIGF